MMRVVDDDVGERFITKSRERGLIRVSFFRLRSLLSFDFHLGFSLGNDLSARRKKRETKPAAEPLRAVRSTQKSESTYVETVFFFLRVPRTLHSNYRCCDDDDDDDDTKRVYYKNKRCRPCSNRS
jgi:hypothetical protein